MRMPCCPHCQVLPSKPCQGVEVWSSKPGCLGESIWDELLTQGIKSTDIPTYGGALNPTNKRTQHQAGWLN